MSMTLIPVSNALRVVGLYIEKTRKDLGSFLGPSAKSRRNVDLGSDQFYDLANGFKYLGAFLQHRDDDVHILENP